MLGIARRQPGDVIDRLDQGDAPIRQLADGAQHLGVAGMADQDDLPSRRLVPVDFGMDLGDQRAGGVEIEHVAPLGLAGHRTGHAMSREDHRPVVRRVAQVLDEHRAQGPQPLDHVAVVHDLMADIDRRPILLDGALHDLDRPVDAGAEASRAGQEDGQPPLGSRSGVHGVAIRATCAPPPAWPCEALAKGPFGIPIPKFATLASLCLASVRAGALRPDR